MKPKESFDLYAGRHEQDKVSHNVQAIGSEKSRKNYHLYPPTSRPQIKRPLTVSRTNSELKNIGRTITI